MKTINKIITCLVLLVSMGINANTILPTGNEELINSMSKDENVNSFILNAMKISLYPTLVKLTPQLSKEDREKQLKAMAVIIEKRNTSLAKMYADYPVYSNYNESERKYIFEQVLIQTRTKIRVGVLMGCMGGAIVGIGTCVNSATVAWKRWATSACVSAAVVTDVVATASTLEYVIVDVEALIGTSVEAIVTAFRAEVQGCTEAVYPEFSVAEVTVCVGTAIVVIGGCLESFFQAL